jgi:REP element-mobilizing transposase RayT
MTKFDPDKHHRRSIRLKNYDYSGNGAYFVTLCTFDRGCYFDDFSMLRKIVENYWLDIPGRYSNTWLDEYVIMPNHFHGILMIDDSQQESLQNSKPVLGSVIGSFKSLCVNAWLKTIKEQNINARGKFWQDNYYEHVVRSEAELESVREYILNNPAQWALDRENIVNSGKVGSVEEKWMV